MMESMMGGNGGTSGGGIREVECRVCGDKASGKHYGVPSCDGCRGFFKRSIRRNLDYVCKENGSCVVDVTRRNQCQSCRFKKCLKVNMKRDAVQHERAPRSSASIGKSRIPFHSFANTSMGGNGGSLFFPIGGSHHQSYKPNGGTLYGSTTFQSQLPPPPSLSLLGPHFTHHSRLLGHHPRSISHTAVIVASSEPIVPPPLPLSIGPPKEIKMPSREEEVSTTTNNDQVVEFYHHPLLMSNETVYESAAKLLFLSIKWARSVPSFSGLSAYDQGLLLENSWSELFILGGVQWGLLLDEPFLLGKNGIDMSNARKLMELLSRIATLNLDQTELACLKAVVLFKPEVVSFGAELRVQVLQEQTMLMLQEYCIAKAPLNKVRFGRLLLIYSSLKTISSGDLESLFFKHTVGDVSIQKLISDLVRSTF